MNHKIKFAVGSVIIFLLCLVFIFGSYSWFLGKQRRVENGTARATFPYSDYSQEELNKMYPQYAPEVATVRTPEQTHALFMGYLKSGDINNAVECCFMKGDWVEQKNFLQGVKDRGMWNLMVGDLSEIDQDMMLDTIATYEYAGTLNGKKSANFIEFVKNFDGIWLIKSL